jgi:thiol-disulfide isomerase/thioredoxin
MKNIIFLILFSFFIKGEKSVEVLKWPQLQSILEKDNGKVKIVNFWATWCKPCMQELPDFEKIHLEYKDKNVEVILVSLDQASMANTRVKASLEKNTITARVILLDEVDFNKWINNIDSTWSGAIPATLVIYQKNNVRQFYEKQFSYTELKQIINTINP